MYKGQGKPSGRPLSLPAPAKINLHLKVTGKTANGYHTLDTSFAYMDIADTLILKPSGELRVSCSDPRLDGRKNLVFRVLDAMRKAYGVRQGLNVHVDKVIPVQAGLGGGSSNAATAIIAANALWSLHLDRQTLINFSRPFGADIPCFLFGQSSRAGGLGDRLMPLDCNFSNWNLVLAWPGAGLSTAEVFARYDEQLETGAAELTLQEASDTIRAASQSVKNISLPLGENGLEKVACGMCPGLATLLERMRAGGRSAWMSGSGTACVALVENPLEAQTLARELKRKGVATWTHAGRVLERHPLDETMLETEDWGVAKW